MKDRNLFKGKTKGEKTGHEELDWAVGNLVEELSTGRCFIVDLSHFTDETKLKDVMIEVEPETICQCAGLKDKNGKLIWENDFLNVIYSDKKGDVHFAENCVIKDIRTTSIIGWLDCANEIEVIGNIFDNPELLEGQ